MEPGSPPPLDDWPGRDDERAPTETEMRILGPMITWRQRITALVVDQSRFYRMTQRSALIAHGVAAAAIPTGNAAVGLIYDGRAFDLIVVDSYSDGYTGIQTVRQLRSIGVRSMIVGTSVMQNEDEREAFLDAGADYYIVKPFTPDKFIHVLVEIASEL